MKKIILTASCLAFLQLAALTTFAQKEKTNESKQEIIIIKKGDKESKLTVETKDGEVFINGKPSSEYKDGDVSVIMRKFMNENDFNFSAPRGSVHLFSTWDSDKKPFLGVTTEKVNEGAKITNVTKGSAAEKAGLKEGDIITRVGSKNISDPENLIEVVRNFKPKDDVTISYKRDGKNGETKAILGERNLINAFNINGGFNKMRDLNLAMPPMPREPFSITWNPGRPRLGVRIEDTESETGVKITGVNEDSPAAKAGLKENDIITAINNNKVKNVTEARKEIADVKEKNSYNITAKRNGADMNFEVKIPKRLNKAEL